MLVLAAGGACSVSTPEPLPVVPAAEAPVWPRPPAAPRIRYVRSVAQATDWGIARGGVRRLLGALAGEAEERLVRPTGVAERAGVLFVADPGAQALFILDQGRRRMVKIDRLDNEPLVSPVAVALGPGETVFLADSWLKKVFVVERDGKLLRKIIDTGLARPAAVAYDAARARLYVADSMAHQVIVYGADGSRLKTFGSNGRQDGQFNSPTHLALAADGRVLVTDALNFRIQVFDAEGNFLGKWGRHGDGAGDFAAPKGVATDSAGNVYVADALFNAVQIFDREGALLLGFGDMGTRAGQFSLPGGLFMGASDALYVADSYNQRIQVFQPVRDGAKEGAR